MSTYRFLSLLFGNNYILNFHLCIYFKSFFCIFFPYGKLNSPWFSCSSLFSLLYSTMPPHNLTLTFQSLPPFQYILFYLTQEIPPLSLTYTYTDQGKGNIRPSPVNYKLHSHYLNQCSTSSVCQI